MNCYLTDEHRYSYIGDEFKNLRSIKARNEQGELVSIPICEKCYEKYILSKLKDSYAGYIKIFPKHGILTNYIVVEFSPILQSVSNGYVLYYPKFEYIAKTYQIKQKWYERLGKFLMGGDV